MYNVIEVKTEMSSSTPNEPEVTRLVAVVSVKARTWKLESSRESVLPDKKEKA